MMNLHWSKLSTIIISICFVIFFSISAFSELKRYTKAQSLFAIVYDNALFKEDDAKSLHAEAEKAYDQYQQWGFNSITGYMGNKKLKIYMVESITTRTVRQNQGGVFNPWDPEKAPWVEIKRRGAASVNDYYGILYHELFHAIQYSYDPRFNSRFLTEATASAMTDELINVFSHNKILPDYIKWGHKGAKQELYITNAHQHGFANEGAPYDSHYTFSLFFTWLIQEFSSYRPKTDIVKNIWEKTGSAIQNIK